MDGQRVRVRVADRLIFSTSYVIIDAAVAGLDTAYVARLDERPRYPAS